VTRLACRRNRNPVQYACRG